MPGDTTRLPARLSVCGMRQGCGPAQRANPIKQSGQKVPAGRYQAGGAVQSGGPRGAVTRNTRPPPPNQP